VSPVYTSPRLLSPPFENRVAAGRLLAEILALMLPEGAAAVGLARGGVVVAAEIARMPGWELDVVAVRKIGAPGQPEYALGAVAPGGVSTIRDRAGLTDAVLDQLVAAAESRAGDLDRRLHAESAPLDLAGRVCVLVDDGLATGATMVAAIRWAHAHEAARVLAAVPVAARTSAPVIAEEAAELVCPYLIVDFGALGFWYDHFEQVDDAEVVRLLSEARARA
jgi:putative phosphoribosyl transferase